EREGPYEFACRGGHHDLHLGTTLTQAPNQVRALIGSDATGHTEQDTFALHGRIIGRRSPAVQTNRSREAHTRRAEAEDGRAQNRPERFWTRAARARRAEAQGWAEHTPYFTPKHRD